MMPPPQHSKTCVESIKKKFENANRNVAEGSYSTKANLSPKTQPLNGSAGEQCNASINKSESPRKKKPPGNISGRVIEPSYIASAPVQIVPLKIERQISSSMGRNIRRSPAFRCDKVVRARNINSQSACRDLPKSVVVRRVKQFDDQSDVFDDPILQSEDENGKPLLWRSKLKTDSSEGKSSKSTASSESKFTSPSKNCGVEVQKVCVLGSPNISPEKGTNPDVCSAVCSAINSGESDNSTTLPFRKSSPPTSMSQEKIFNKRDCRYIEKLQRNDVNYDRKDTHTNSSLESDKLCKVKNIKSVSNSNHDAAVKAALESPLPCGPPPKKPPRTFAHLSVTKPKGSTSAILSLEPPPIDTSSSVIKPMRSKTESQILLQKLENAFGGVSNQKPSTDNKKLSRNNFNSEKGEPNSHRDLPPDLLSVQPQKHSIKNLKGHLPAFKLGNCFNSLSCAGDSGVYSHIIAHDLRQGDQNPELISTEEAHQKLYDTFHRAYSEEHIYAEPFEHMNPVNGSGDQLCSEKRISCVKRSDLPTSAPLSKLKPSTQGDSRSGGLHYLCSPIHESVPVLSSDMQTRSLPVPFEAINRELVGVVGPTSLPVDTVKMGQAPNHSAVPAAASRVTGAADTIETDSGLNPTKIKLLMNQAFGSPLQRLPAVGVDSSDSDSVASTSDEGPLPQKPPATPTLRPTAPNTNIREIRRPSVPPPDIPDVSKEALQQLTAERRAYIRRVSSHAMSTRSRRVCNAGSGESRLIDCVLLVGVNLDPDRPKCKVPYIKSTYPPDEEVPPHIADFCFPDASEWPPPVVEVEAGAIPGEEQCYCIVLTTDKGDRKYGYCRRVQPEGATLCLPLAYCLLTSHRASGLYFKVLGELESRHGQSEASQVAFIKELYTSGFPSSGQYIRIHCGDASVSQTSGGGSAVPYAQIKRQYDPRLEERDLSRLFVALTIPVLIQVFGSLLMERKVLFTSSSISKLSACVDALESALFPFSWHHTCVSVLPAAMLEWCCAPLPYIMGVLKGKKLQRIPQIEDGIVVDLDTSTILQCMGDEMTILPDSMYGALKKALQLVRDCTTPHDSVRNVLVSEAFVRLFVELCGHYINHIEVQQDGKKVFAKESFIKAAPPRAQPFLECFTDTAMFSVFIDSRLDKVGDTKGMFEQRVAEHCEERERNTLFYLKNYKGLNRKKTLGDRFKDWTLF